MLVECFDILCIVASPLFHPTMGSLLSRCCRCIAAEVDEAASRDPAAMLSVLLR